MMNISLYYPVVLFLLNGLNKNFDFYYSYLTIVYSLFSAIQVGTTTPG